MRPRELSRYQQETVHSRGEQNNRTAANSPQVSGISFFDLLPRRLVFCFFSRPAGQHDWRLAFRERLPNARRAEQLLADRILHCQGRVVK